MPKLTKVVVDRADLRGRQYTIWCADLPGFGVYVYPSGRKSYFVDYRVDSGRRRMTIGRHGVITTDEARKLAIETLGGVVLKKEDPLQERRTRRASLNVAELCDRYQAASERGLVLGRSGRSKKASTLLIDRGRIDRHIKPLLGSKLVVDLTRADINKFVQDVTIGKTAKKDRSGINGARVEVSGGAGTAARTAGLLGGILTYAVETGVIDQNPVRGIRLPKDNVRTRRVTSDEYQKIGDVLQAADYDTPQAVTGSWLLALTGCRLGEIEGLRWDEVDEAGQCFRLSDSKTGASVRPVGPEVFIVLSKALRVTGNPYVLPALRKNGRYSGLWASWTRFMKRAGIEGVTPHTMRHSFASVAADLDYSEATIGVMIGHSSGSMTSRYTHRLDSVLIAAAAKVCRQIYRDMNREQHSEVVEV